MTAPMLVASRGEVRVYAIDGGRLRLDGGAMFGVVPKPLWSRRIPADERNRIPLAMRCLLVEAPDGRVLVDTGLGNKESDKFRDIYGVENPGRPTCLEDGLRSIDVEPEDIDVVINTHLHFDHAGGNTTRAADGALRASFPNARYLIRKGEWDFAHRENERVRASYLRDNFDLLAAEDRVEWLESDGETFPGVSVLHTPGHTPHHQSVLVRVGDETICFVADLVPTAAHLPLSWIMGYDLDPLVTLENKRRLLRQAVAEGWILVFEHDSEVAWGRAAPPENERMGCAITEVVREPEREADGEGGARADG